MALRILKSGYLKRFSKSMFSGGWKDVWVVLYDNSDLCMYNRQGDLEIKAKIHMKDVCKRFAFGDYTSSFPNRPDLPRGSSYEHVLAIPHKNNSQAKVFWFLCRDSNDLHEWMNAICQVLPAPAQKQPAGGMHPSSSSGSMPPMSSAPPASAPPPYSPAPSGPGIGFDGLSGGSAPYPTQPGGFPQAGPPQPYMPPQGYPQQQPAAYPQQPAAYPQQAYQQYPQQPYQQYPQQPYQQYPQQPYQQYPQQQYQQPYGYTAPGYQQQYVVKPQKSKSGGMLGGNTGKLAAGLIGGAALGYGASRMMGHGFGGPFGWGLGHHGSWSSLSSFGSFGSFGSFD